MASAQNLKPGLVHFITDVPKDRLELMLLPIVELPTRPNRIAIDLEKSSLLVIDMQNAFLSPGGMFDILGFDVLRLRRVIVPCKVLLDYWRKAGLKVVFVRHVYSKDLSDAGGPESPNYWKELCLVLIRERPELKDKLLIEGSWGAEIVDEVRPLPGEPVVEKQRYSAFVNTELEELLKSFNAKYLFFTGIALNVCVESAVRDAFFREFWPIVVSDCCEAIGPKGARRASLWNINQLFGWTTTSRNLIKVIKRFFQKSP